MKTDPHTDSHIRRRRLYFRSIHCGVKELDLILGRFARCRLDGLTAAEIDRYEALLASPDHDIYDWIIGRATPPAAIGNDLINLIRNVDDHSQ